MIFSPGTLRAALQSMPASHAGMVGFSGGMDSVVLLHALVQLRAQDALAFNLRALHVNHGLNPRAGQWQAHCAALCREWDVPFASVALDLAEAMRAGTGIENAARNARYAAFTEQLGEREALLLAHHRDDQIETVLLRLMRGAGPRGLAGMPMLRTLGSGFLFRPLLSFDRSALVAYASEQQLHWVEDESNNATQFDRNYCRHKVLPLIEARWPAYRDSWSKSATLQAEADILLQELAEADLGKILGAACNELRLDDFTQLGKPRQRNLLRHWLRQLQLPEPGWNDLQQLTEAVIPAAANSGASWQADGYCITRYQDRLFALRTLEAIDRDATLEWNPVTQPILKLPHNGSLRARPSSGSADDARLAVAVSGTLHVRYRDGGESLRLKGRPHKSLKKILQEQGIAPWCRERLPLLYVDDELICIPGTGATELIATEDAVQLVIEWQRPDWIPVAS